MTPSVTRLLLIDDDAELSSLVGRYLAGEGFQVDWEGDPARGAERACGGEHAIVLLDVMLPGLDGFEVLRRIRTRSRIPVLMLTAKGDTADRVTGLDLGADDYLAKPFEPPELAARIRAILRRSPPSSAKTGRLKLGDLELDFGARSVHREGSPVPLTSVEFDLLAALMGAQGAVVSRESLTRTVLGREFSPFDRSIDTHIYNLRRKIGPLPDGAERIKGIRGTGYLFTVPAARGNGGRE